ncbi:hypothetical protein GOV12_06155 [Candidatus Pacearchaeota archaeon]|nr:hypothetical protein [Candidatus Pacearchaeota archaeon]
MTDSGLENYNHLVSLETFSRIRRLHREFVDEMHPYFDVEPTYVEDIQFVKILGGLYGLDDEGKPIIYFNEMYARTPLVDDVFGSLNLDRTMLHESAHHLHYNKHESIFSDYFTLELIIDYSVVHYFQLKKMYEHIGVIKDMDDIEALELFQRLGSEQDLKSLLTLPQEKVFRIYSKALGANHPYLKDRRNARRSELRELRKKSKTAS